MITAWVASRMSSAAMTHFSRGDVPGVVATGVRSTADSGSLIHLKCSARGIADAGALGVLNTGGVADVCPEAEAICGVDVSGLEARGAMRGTGGTGVPAEGVVPAVAV
jgi:hypothetical protein